jgi:hypothetical protein
MHYAAYDSAHGLKAVIVDGFGRLAVDLRANQVRNIGPHHRYPAICHPSLVDLERPAIVNLPDNRIGASETTALFEPLVLTACRFRDRP